MTLKEIFKKQKIDFRKNSILVDDNEYSVEYEILNKDWVKFAKIFPKGSIRITLIPRKNANIQMDDENIYDLGSNDDSRLMIAPTSKYYSKAFKFAK